VVTVFQTIVVEAKAVTDTCHEVLAPESDQLKETELLVVLFMTISETKLMQVLTQSRLKQVALFTALKIRAAGCGPKPLLKLIPTPESK
jgi:hypothetical protein